MKKVGGLVPLFAMAMVAFACGGNVSVDGGSGSGGHGTTTQPVACPGFSGTTAEMEALVGQPCATGSPDCGSGGDGSGCELCLVTCSNGVWAPGYDGGACYYLMDC